MWKWIKRNWKQSIIIAACIYAVHLILEVTIVNTLTAIIGGPTLSLA